MRTLSLRMRLTMWYTVALLLVLALFGADILWQQGRIGLRRTDRELDAFIDTFSNVLADEMHESSGARAAAREALDTVTGSRYALAVLDARGIPLTTRWRGLTLPEPWPDAISGSHAWTTGTSAGSWRVHARPGTFAGTTLVLLVAAPLSDVEREQREGQEAMFVGFPIVLVLAGAGGLWVASIGLRPITEMARRATQLPLNGLEDLGVPAREDELGQLAHAFNSLVARLRAALVTQRQFMADASHELRTPLSVIKTAADVALTRTHRDEPEYREALTIVGGEAHRAGRLVEDMLVLARADAGAYQLRPVNLYLDEVVMESRRAIDVLAVARGVAIEATSTTEIPFRGDEFLLRQLIVNVLQNAVQHTPTGGAVRIAFDLRPDCVEIRVRDTGSGIPVEASEKIFDRFVQLDDSRRATGTGLGLPIARWIAEAHGGTLTLEQSGPGGSTFKIVLPGQFEMPGIPETT